MASIRQDKRSGNWIVQFRYDKPSPYTKSVGPNKQHAETKKAEIEETTYLLREGLISVPAGVDVATWIFTRGKVEKKPKAPSQNTICELADLWLSKRRLDVSAGQLSSSSYASDYCRIDKFKKFVSSKFSEASEDKLSDILTSYQRTRLRSLVSGAKPRTIKHELRTVEVMVRWGFREHHIQILPRCIEEYAKIKIPSPDPEFFTIDEVKMLYNAAPGKSRLYMLLALNCGYTQMDISSLSHHMIDWDAGIIRRSRHKTDQPQEHKLWPDTRKFLQQYMTNPNEHDLCLLGERGNPLLYECIRKNGKPYRVDTIRLAFNRIRKECDIAERTFTTLRNTGANAIAKNFQKTPWLVDMYLGHSEKATKKFYVATQFDELHKATDWLACHFGMDSCDTL